ncbi:unnamed protein product [Acanthoscelides obtectus]|uniref:Uncharacterized protein n=1 Tax=Acanthoscelides obtectus TaxID=200917 RepID=A0A9P0JMQ1_ACAOB|nr:unnamed protein product [Acanthoscelides obtectus]CAK1665749.1 hypothetical protein AOBTE_LOCUS24951 [Acanthoscelides obtectus]
MYREAVGWSLTFLLLSSTISTSSSYPNHAISTPQMEHGGFRPIVQSESQQIQQQPIREERKFAEKPNAIKKVALDDLDNDIQTNQISESTGGGFSWSSLLGMVMQMIFNPGGGHQGPNKSEGLDEGPVSTSPWANLLSVGLKILTAILGGGQTSEGIDKVDNGNSPMQGILAAVLPAVLGARDPDQVNMMAKQASEFINIVVNLLDALKTSFSHRSLAARNLGRKDSVSDAAVAGIAMAKGYMRSLNTNNDSCMQRYICEATTECSNDVGQSSLYCHLGSYAVSFILDKSVGSSFDVLYEAGRRGRYGDNCQQQFLECNEV